MTAPYDLPPRPVSPSALPPLDVGPRAGRVRARMAAAGVDALLVTDLTNVRWLTGFTGSAGRALLLPDELVLVTDGRYEEQAAEELAAAGAQARVAVGRSLAIQMDALADGVRGLGRLGLEAEHVSWAAHGRYRDALSPTLVATSGLVEAERRTKDAGEVARIEHACRAGQPGPGRRVRPARRRAHGGGVRAGPRGPRCAPRRARARASSRSSRAARTRPSPTTARRTVRSARATA